MEAQIKDLNELQKSLVAEVKAVQAQVRDQEGGAKKQDVGKTVGVLADALLVNTLQTRFGKQILGEEESKALAGALEVFSAIQGASEVLPYDRMREGFVHLFQAFV